MAQRTEQISLHLNAYLCAHSSPPDAVLRELANETADLFPNETGLAIAPEQGTLMTLLTQIAGAATAIEIGTFTGYSSICIARGLAAGGSLLCCDISEEWTSVARKYWEKAGLQDRIELRLGPGSRAALVRGSAVRGFVCWAGCRVSRRSIDGGRAPRDPVIAVLVIWL